jgi:hypothetical protein
MSAGPGASVELEAGTIRRTRAGLQPGTGLGAVAQRGATAILSGVTVEENEGAGAFVAEGASLILAGSMLARNRHAGVIVSDGFVSMDGGALRDTSPGADGGGVGFYLSDRFGTGALTVTGVEVTGNTRGALYVLGAHAIAVQGGSIRGTGPLVFAHRTGHREGGAGMLVDGVAFDDVGGDGVLLDAAGGTLTAIQWGSVSGERLVRQRCEGADDVVIDGDVDANCRETWIETTPHLDLLPDLAETALDP